MLSLRHLKAMVLLVLINLLSFGSTQVHSQGYGDTRQVQESRATYVSSTNYTYTAACPYSNCYSTIYGRRTDRTYDLETRWRYERFNARHGVWVVTGYSEWEYRYSYTEEGSIIWGNCSNTSCPNGPVYGHNGQRLGLYYALCRLRSQGTMIEAPSAISSTWVSKPWC